MYCPECKTEYREGFTRCSDCDVDLVHELPGRDSDSDIELVKVFESSNPALVPVIHSVLTDADIAFLMRNRNMEEIFGGGYITQLTGPVQFWVRKEDEEAALELLEEIEEAGGEVRYIEEPNHQRMKDEG